MDASTSVCPCEAVRVSVRASVCDTHAQEEAVEAIVESRQTHERGLEFYVR